MTTMTAAEQQGWQGTEAGRIGKIPTWQDEEDGGRKMGGQHVSAHFTAQAFSLNKMLSGGEKATDKKQRQLMKGTGKRGCWCGWDGWDG